MKKILFLFIIALIAYSTFTFFKKNNNSDNKLILSQGTKSDLTLSIIPGSSEKVKPTRFTTLEEAVKNSLERAVGKYAVAIKNLKTGESFFLNEHQLFDSGSIYKLWIMGTVFSQIENEQLTEDQVLRQNVAVLNRKFNIASTAAERTEGTIALSVVDAVYQMITYSDNYAALLLSEKVRLSKVADYLKLNGLNESKVGTDGSDPTTTALDTMLFFEKLLGNNLANEEHTGKMIAYLKAQKLNNKLPLYLPQGTIVAHKTGEIYGFSHDAGIVYGPKGNYLISVFSETKLPSGAEERIARLSRSVYDYFN